MIDPDHEEGESGYVAHFRQANALPGDAKLTSEMIDAGAEALALHYAPAGETMDLLRRLARLVWLAMHEAT